MGETKYFGFYSTQIGASTFSVLTEPQDDVKFPPGIFYNSNSYRFIRYYRTSSPKQIKDLQDWALNSSIEINIQLNF